jgi:hypothetical protein
MTKTVSVAAPHSGHNLHELDWQKMPFFFNITGWGAEGPLPQTSLRLTADALSCALPRVPHFGGKSPTLPTAHERCGKMGILGKDGSNPLIFDGRPESWPPFKKALHQLLDKEGYGWVVEGRDVFCAMLQAASAKAAKSTVTSGKGTVSTDVADYQKKDLQTAFTNASVTTSVLLELIANRKTVLGAHHADHEKMGMTEEELAQAHAVLDAKRLTMVNHTVVRWLHDAVYPNASETPATSKLRSILKTPEVTKILQGEKLTTES